MSSPRSIGLIALLPLYLAIATAIGYVDLRVRTHPERSLQYVDSVVAGAEEPPGRYRILAPYAVVGFEHVTGFERANSWIAFRWICLLGAMLAGHFYFRSWFDAAPSAAGNVLIAALIPLTFTNAWSNPDQFTELCLFTLGCAAVARGWTWTFVPILVLNALNRETSAFLVLLFALARPLTRRHLIWSGGIGALWALIYVGLRWWRGFATYNPWQLSRNLHDLKLLESNWDPYYRSFAWFGVLLAVPLMWLAARRWSAQPRFNKAAVGIVAPAFLVVGLLFSTIAESRIFTPLLPLLVPAALTTIFSTHGRAETA